MPSTLPSPILEAAATWYVDLRDVDQTDALHEAHRQWLAESPQHRQAWARVEKLQQQMGGLPNGMGGKLNKARLSRRQAIKTLSLALVAVAGGAVWQQYKTPFPELRSNYVTAIGERQQVTLTDNAMLQLNTATAVEVNYNADLRELRLHQGEVQIETAPDVQARPFIIHTRHGSVRALGTRFLVKTDWQSSQVAVLEHAVEVRVADYPGAVTRVAAGQQLQFDRSRAETRKAITPHIDAWTRGLLVVSNWRLADFIDELSRYHQGRLSCHNSIADLRISGAFQLDNTQVVLENLANTLPIQLHFIAPHIIRLEPQG